MHMTTTALIPVLTLVATTARATPSTKVNLVAKSDVRIPSRSSKDVAEAKPHAESDPASQKRSLSITFSPVRAFGGVAELAFEARLSRRVGFAGIVGAGAVEIDGRSSRLPVVLAGVSPRWYALGHFDHGLQLGAEVLGSMSWVGTSTSLLVTAAPYVGYKVTAPVGFTFEVQVGCGYRLAYAERVAKSEAVPLVNLNLGWAF